MNIIKKNMNQENPAKINKVLSILLLICWCFLIFYLSNQNGDISEQSSSRILNFLNNIFNTNLYEFKYSVYIIRKLAHMFLYFILYFLSYYVAYSFKLKRKYLFTLLFCLVYAMFDEFHQLFIWERSGSMIDVLIDMVGSSISYLLLKFFNN